MWQNCQRPKLWLSGSGLTLLVLARHILAVWLSIYSTPSMICVDGRSSGSTLPKSASTSWPKSSPLRPAQYPKEGSMLIWATIEDDLILEEGLNGDGKPTAVDLFCCCGGLYEDTKWM